MAASKLLRQSGWRGYEDVSCLCVLIDLGVTTLLLVFCARTIRRDGSLQLSRFSNALTLLALLRVLGNRRSVFGVVVGQAFLLARGLVGALGLLFAGLGLVRLIGRLLILFLTVLLGGLGGVLVLALWLFLGLVLGFLLGLFLGLLLGLIVHLLYNRIGTKLGGISFAVGFTKRVVFGAVVCILVDDNVETDSSTDDSCTYPWDVTALSLTMGAVFAGVGPALHSSLPWLELGGADIPGWARNSCKRGSAGCGRS